MIISVTRVNELSPIRSVASKNDKNLMTTSNLGVCFGPTLLRPEEETVASITDLKFYNVVVEVLIENFSRIFNSEPERLNSEQRPKSPNNSSNSVYNNVRGSPSELMPSTYVGPDGTEVLHAGNPRNYSPNDQLNNSGYPRKQYKWKPSYNCVSEQFQIKYHSKLFLICVSKITLFI